MNSKIESLSLQDEKPNQLNELSVFFNVAGLYQKIIVQDGWFVGDLIKFMAKISSNLHPNAEIPECNAIRNNQTRKFIALADPASRAFIHGNLYDLLFIEKASKSSNISGMKLNDEIQIVFYNNPLGITMKPTGDGTYVVAMKKKELNCYRRLLPGMEVVSVGSIPLRGMDFREFHTTMSNSVFPLTVVFRATHESIDTLEKLNNPIATLPETSDSKQVVSENSNQSDTFNLPVPVVIHDDGSIESKVRRLIPPLISTPKSNQQESNSFTTDESSIPSATFEDETRLEEGLKSLNEAFYKKKRELNEIVERIREYTQQLTAVRFALGKHDGNGLTLDMVLEKQSRRKGPSSVISNSSSITSSVVQSNTAPSPARHNSFLPPKSRASKLSSSASVCSLTSTCSIDRMAFKKSKHGVLQKKPEVSLSGRAKKPLLNTNAFSSTLNLPSSFSTKGAVIPQAQTPRGAFLTPKSITPGVGHYDVKELNKNVKGGEIGDSDRDLTWS